MGQVRGACRLDNHRAWVDAESGRCETRGMIRGGPGAAAALCAIVVALWLAPGAPAAVPFTPCEPAGVSCATVNVPLDRSGVTPGTIDLAVGRKPATSGTTTGVLVALTGGPGGAAIPLIPRFGDGLAAALASRDLVVFDVRGVGLSGAISCGLPSRRTFDDIRGCAEQLGSLRAFFHSHDTADDLEAVRIAAGADRVAIYAVSYGAVAAYDYAARYPARVEWMILDSPVAPAGFDPTMQERVALPRVLRSVCAGKCPASMKPARDLATLVPRIRRTPLNGRLVRPNGHTVTFVVSATRLYSALAQSDVSLPLRSLIPAALRGAVAGDPAPLIRLAGLVRGDASPRSGTPGQDADSTTVNFATNCEEGRFPWARDAPPRSASAPWPGPAGDQEARAAAIAAALSAVPASRYAPFNAREVTGSAESVVRQCIGWPHTARIPSLDTVPAPDIPVLVLAGEHDLRTPLESAERIAGRFPRAQLVLAQYTGHAVLSGSPRAIRPCVLAAVGRFAVGTPAGTTCRGTVTIPPLRTAPTVLAQVAPVAGLSGAPGRTAAAVLATLDDVKYVYAAASTSEGVPSIAAGGLRAGRFSGTLRRVRLDRVVYVPGVVVSGTYDIQEGTASVKITGLGARGTLRLTRSRLTGRLDGQVLSRPRPARPTPLR